MSEARADSGLVRKVVTGTLLGVVAFAGLSVYGDARALYGRLAAYDFRYFVLGLALATANYGVRFLRWQYYLARLDVRIPWRSSLRIFVAGFVMSISPGKIGEVLKSALIAEQFGVSAARTAPVVVAERLTDLLALVVLLAVAAQSIPGGGPVAIVGGVAVATIWLLCASPWVGDRALRLLVRVPRVGRLDAPLREALDALHTVVGPLALLWATALGVLSWSLECVSLAVIARGFPGVTIGLAEATFAYAAPTIVGALAMLPGGVVVTEAGMTGALVRVGGIAMNVEVATGTTILVRLATLWWAVLLGLVALYLHRRAVELPAKR